MMFIIEIIKNKVLVFVCYFFSVTICPDMCVCARVCACVNDMVRGVCNSLLKFADDTKLLSQVASCKCTDKLQRNLNKMHG